MYKINSKLFKQEVNKTSVFIIQEEPYTVIQREIQGNYSNIADDLTIKEVLKVVSQELNPTDFINEIKEKLNKIETEQDVIKKSVINIKDLDSTAKTELLNTYADYEVGKLYAVGDKFKFNDVIYEVIQPHTSQSDWIPNLTPELYKEYLNMTVTINGTPTEVINDFKQPTGAQDTYKKGDKVMFNGKVYESTIDNNDYSPTDYPQGWKEVI